MPAILAPNGRPASELVPFLGPSISEDSYLEDPEFSDEFEPALWVLMHNYDITMDPTVDVGRTRQQQLAAAQLGVLEATFNNWRIYVNWTTRWAQKIPPHHMAVEFAKRHEGSTDWRLVGILSPYLPVRTCWNCGRGDPSRATNGWDEGRYYVERDDTKLRQMVLGGVLSPQEASLFPAKFPAVMPAHPCPACQEYDWFGDLGDNSVARREDFQVEAASEIARMTDESSLYDAMRVRHDPAGVAGTRMARTTV